MVYRKVLFPPNSIIKGSLGDSLSIGSSDGGVRECALVHVRLVAPLE